MTESGDIEVMGTSFDARTYDDQLIVTCIEGRVKVKTGGSQTELTANMEATGKDGKISTQTVPDGTCALGWTKGEFSFYNRPMEDVLRDVERCYDVKIGMPQELEHVRYTGRFPRGKSVQEVLKILGETFGTEFKIIP
jgi:ferric-dicitrate binding protein FerR (iron transport regulator)